MAAHGETTGLPDLSQEELALLLSLGDRLVSDLELESVLAQVAETACKVVQAETLAVPIIDADGRTFTYRAAAGEHAAVVLGQTLPIREGACGWVLQNRRPLLFGADGDFELDPNARWREGMASSLLVPLVCRGTIIGGLSAMGKRGGGTFSRRDQTVLTLFSNQAGIAIDNARLFQRLGAEEARLRLVLESTAEGIYGVDMEGRCTFANRASLRLLGYGAETDLIGRDMHATVHHSRPDGSPLPADRCEVHRSLHCGGEAHADTEVYWRADGSAFPVEYWAHPQVLAGEVVGAVITFVDISERKQAAEALRALNQALEQRVAERTAALEQANHELEAFSYSVSHDLRAPLRAIDGFSNILADEYHDRLDPDGRRYLKVIRRNAMRMGDLIDDILDFSRMSRRELAPGPIDVAAMAREVFEEVRGVVPERRVELRLGRLPAAQGDRAMIRQVLTNLFSNAVKFTAPRPRAVIEMEGVADGTQNAYRVKDNGVGFDMQYGDKLFGVFQRLHGVDEFEGTGIGLAIVKRIVTRHGGRVWAEGRVGEGATFGFTLPRG